MTLQVFFNSNSAETDLRASVNLLSFKRVQVEYFAITSCKASRLKETEPSLEFLGSDFKPGTLQYHVGSHLTLSGVADGILF